MEEEEITGKETRVTKIRECYRVLGEIGGPLESFDEEELTPPMWTHRRGQW